MSELNYSPWEDPEKVEVLPNGLTKSNVDFQDYYSDKIGSLVENSLAQVGNTILSSGITNALQDTASILAKNMNAITGSSTVVPKPMNLTSEDEIGNKIIKDKNTTYKAIPLNSKLSFYNDYKNFLGISGSLFVGSLGNAGNEIANFSSNAINDILNTYNLSTGIDVASVMDKIKSGGLAIPTADELEELNLSNFYNIYTSKPGFYVRNVKDFKSLEFITGDNNESKPYTDGQIENFEKNYRYSNIKSKSTGSELFNNAYVPKYYKDENTKLNDNIKQEIVLENPTNLESSRVLTAKVFDRINNHIREIGGIYVEPYYSNGALTCFEIPFEFNPEISGDNMSANYNSVDVMGRLLPLNNYGSSSTGEITLSATYLATAQSNDEEGQKEINIYDPSNTGWAADWTLDMLENIEKQYRSLTLPYIRNKKFVQPPIVRIKFRTLNSDNFKTLFIDRKLAMSDETEDKGTEKIVCPDYSTTVGDLFKYPQGTQSKFYVTKVFDGSDTVEKRYIVKSVKIEPLTNGFGNNYFFDMANYKGAVVKEDGSKTECDGVIGGRRRGFKVSLSLQETTKNFMDLVPNSYDYLYNVTPSTAGSAKIENNYDNNKNSSEFWTQIKEAIEKVQDDINISAKNVVSDNAFFDFSKEEINIVNKDGKLEIESENTDEVYAKSGFEQNIFAKFYSKYKTKSQQEVEAKSKQISGPLKIASKIL